MCVWRRAVDERRVDQFDDKSWLQGQEILANCSLELGRAFSAAAVISDAMHDRGRLGFR